MEMPVAEFEAWREYAVWNGLPTDRIEWAVANAGSAVCHAHGARTHAKNIVPKFRPKFHQVDNKTLIAQLSALPGVKIRKRPRREAVKNGR